MNSSAQKTGDTCMVNCRFNHSILALHLCKEYLIGVKLKTLFLLQIKHWTFWCMDYSDLIKSNTLEKAWNSRNMWTVNNGWVVILVKYGFIRLLQRIFTVTKCMTSVLLQMKYRTVWYIDHFSALSYTWVTYCQKWAEFSWLKLIGIFRHSMVFPNLCQEYLNMATFRILVLLLIKSSTFWYIDRPPTSSYTGVIHF